MTRAESGSVIGVDPSIDHPAVAVWPSGETWQLRVKGRGSERLMALSDAVGNWTRDNYPDDLLAIFIERPTGRFPNPSLAQANGVIQVSMLSACEYLFDYPVSCWEMSPGEWKRRAIGKGNAKKLEVAEWAIRTWDAHPTYPHQTHEFTQDEADALAIAYAGSQALREGATTRVETA